MSIHTRAAALALSAVCFGGCLVGATTALLPSAAAAGGTLSCPAEITGSGSSLQKVAQENVFTADFLSTLCTTTPLVKYTKTSSGPALEEFGNVTGALLPTKSGNAVALDGYVGSDDPPQPVQVNTADAAAGGGDQAELTIPVAEAPVALLLHPPSGCAVEAAPNISNSALDTLWKGEYASWDAFLTAAGVTHNAGCGAAPTLLVRFDNSGTSYVFKSYLNQIDAGTWSAYANDFNSWPSGSHVESSIATKGGSGEAATVSSTAGAVGYAAASDSHAGGFAPWSGGATVFWGKVQNNGTNPSGATYADPANGSNGNCPTSVTPTGAPTAPGNWYGVLSSNPNIAAATGFSAGQYSLCGLTYDLAWADYAKIGAMGQAALYGGSSSAATAIGNATADFLTYVTGPGQSALATAGQYYSSLPTGVQKVAQETVSLIGNPGGGNGGGGGGTQTTTTTTTTTAAPTTTTTTTTSQQVTTSVTPPNVTASAASVVQGGHFAVTVSCPAGAVTCAGTVSVKTAGAITASAASKKSSKHAKIAPFKVGSQSFSLQGGQSKTIAISLNSKAAALLRKHGSLPVIATITVSGGRTVTEHLVLKAKKVKKPTRGKKY